MNKMKQKIKLKINSLLNRQNPRLLNLKGSHEKKDKNGN